MFETNGRCAELFWVVGVILGFIFFAIYDQYGLVRMILMILLNIMVVLAITLCIRIYYKNSMLSYFNKIMAKITLADEELIIDKNEKSYIKQLYSAINALQSKLKHQTKLKDDMLKIVNILVVNNDLQKLLNQLLPKLVDITKSNCGAIYLYNTATDKLELKSSIGFSKNIYKEFDIALGEGFVGKVVQSKEIKILKDIPEDTVYVNKTFMGMIVPKCMMSVPIVFQNELLAEIVFTSVYNYSDEQIERIRLARYYIGVSVNNCLTYERTKHLIKELEFQNQLLQNLNLELEEKTNEAYK